VPRLAGETAIWRRLRDKLMRRFIIAGLVIGFVLNLTGWAGNVFLLGSMWEQAGAVAPPPMHSPFSPLVHAILQFVADFVLAFVLCAVYRLAIASWRGSQMILAFISGQSTLDGWPAWSPDGKRIIFSRRVKDTIQIFAMNRDASGVRQLTDAQGEFTNPRWSPDGTQILCSRRPGDITLVLFPAPQ